MGSKAVWLRSWSWDKTSYNKIKRRTWL